MAPGPRHVRPRLHSLREKLLFPVALGCLAMVLLSFFVTDILGYRLLHDRLEKRAEVTARTVTYAAEVLSDPADLQRLVNCLGAEPDITEIIAVGGEPARVVASTKNVLLGQRLDELDHESVDDIHTAILTHRPSGRIHSSPAAADSTVPVVPFRSRSLLANGAVMVHVDASMMEHQVLSAAIYIAWAFAGVGAVTFAGVWLLAHRTILRPVNAVVQTITSGAESTRIFADDELGFLARALDARYTENRAANEKLQAALRELSSFRSALDEHSIISVADARGRILDVNTGFCRISGYSRDELLGKDHRVVNSRTHPKSFWTDVWRQISAGKPWRGVVCNRRKDGSHYWVDSTIIPCLGADGKIEKFVSIRFDVTAQKAAEDKLRTRDREMNALLAATPGVIFRARNDADWTMDFLSEGVLALSGYPASDFTTRVRSFESMIHPDDSARVREAVNDAISHAIPWKLTYRILHADGSHRWVYESGRAVELDAASPGLIGFIVDVTAQKEAEAQLAAARDAAQEASRAKSEFLANMSHEIRTPMTAILGYSDLLLDESLPGTTRLQHLATIRRNGEHLLGVINDILDLSKIEAGRMEAESVPLSPLAILRDAVSLFDKAARARGIELRLSVDSPIPESISSDPTRLRQILVNLVNNAIKFTPHGSVTASVRLDASIPTSPRLIFSVADTGIGISTDQIDRLFLPFSQADSSMTRRFGGTGLGLRICAGLARLLHADVSVISTPGQGSTFTLTLPIAPADTRRLISPADIDVAPAPAPPPAGPPPARTIARPLDGVRIFLAEDGPDNQRLIAHHLRRAGADVRIFDNGRLLLDALTETLPPDAPFTDDPPCDIVLTDMQMPEMDGYTLASTLRARAWTRPIVALTAHAMLGESDRCFAAGCDRYATKPITPARLIEVCTPVRAPAAA